jgi:hypothetical protein
MNGVKPVQQKNIEAQRPFQLFNKKAPARLPLRGRGD